jgi:4-hydroxy-3-methylbut-2-enyl diphosphate reductase
LLTKKSNSDLLISTSKFTIEINSHSGFCFGVVNAISKAEQNLKLGEKLYCVGSIVHNNQEVERLTKKGLETIEIKEVSLLKNKKILFRAHGEPAESYELLKNSNNELIDATCPVVLKIQQRIKIAFNKSLETGCQIVIYGKENHAEVIGLMGQTKYNALLITNKADISKIDMSKPIELFSQTTMPLDEFTEIADIIRKKSSNRVKINDTVCRQVSDRQKHLTDFSMRFEIIFFVGDPKSSNSKVLFQACKKVNEQSFSITSPADIDSTWLKGKTKIGICGATSTPEWLMKQVAESLANYLNTN